MIIKRKRQQTIRIYIYMYQVPMITYRVIKMLGYELC